LYETAEQNNRRYTEDMHCSRPPLSVGQLTVVVSLFL